MSPSRGHWVPSSQPGPFLAGLQEGKREKMGKEKGQSSQEEGADHCRSFPPAQPLSGCGNRGCPSPRGPTAGLRASLGTDIFLPISLHSHNSTGVFFIWLVGGVILRMDQNQRLTPSQSASRAAGTQVPLEVGRSQPGKAHPSQTCPGSPVRCHQQWEGSGRLWSSLGCFLQVPSSHSSPKAGHIPAQTNPRCLQPRLRHQPVPQGLLHT